MADELRMAAIFREDCQLPPGKMAAQSGHAFLTAFLSCENVELCNEYMENSQPKIVLVAPDLEALFKIEERAKKRGVPTAMIKDHGRTVLKEPTFTVLGLGPMTKTDYNNLTRDLKLAEDVKNTSSDKIDDKRLLEMAIGFEVLPYRSKNEPLNKPFIRQVRVMKTNLPDKPEAWGIFSDSQSSNLAKDGFWDWAPQPSSRDEAFYEMHRWPSAQEAIAFAENHLAAYPTGYKEEEE